MCAERTRVTPWLVLGCCSLRYTERLPLTIANHKPIIEMLRETAPRLPSMFQSAGFDASAELSRRRSWSHATKWRLCHAFHLQCVS